MKKMVSALAILASAPALADHSIAGAMLDSPALKSAVELTMQANKVVCDIEQSNQAYLFPGEAGALGTAWKQVALCFRSEDDLKNARASMEKGASFYSIYGIVGVLVVKYTWEDYQVGKVISVSYQ